MARNPVQSQTVASGVDLTSDPVTMPLNRARAMVNFQNERLGLLRTDLRLVDQLPIPSLAPIDGVNWYYRATIPNHTIGAPFDILTDLLVWVTGGFLFIAQPSSDPLLLPVVNTSIVFGGITGYCGSAPFFSGKRVRFAALQSELLMVQEGGLLPLRYYATPTLGSGFFRAGIEPPLSSGSFANLILSATGTGLTGTWGYKLTFADERGRESSPTPDVDITLSNQGTHAAFSTVYASPPTAYGGSNLVTAYLYRNTIGAPSTYYRIASHTIPISGTSFAFGAGDFFFDGAAFDDAPDTAIVAGTLAPSPGENDPPNPASVIAIWKNRVLLNDITDSSTVQIGNTLSTTQFTSIPIAPVTATNGLRDQVGTDQGDPIIAIMDFGSYAAIFKRRACFFLSGNDLSNFLVQPVHTRGCIAPDTAVRCDDIVLFLSDDGVYAASYGGGESVSKVSKEIEATLLSLPQTARETAYAWFVENSYHLQVGSTTFVYNLDVLGWTTYILGLTFAFGGGNAGDFGSVVSSGGTTMGGTGTPIPVPPPASPPQGCGGGGLVHWYKADAGVFSDAGITPATGGAAVQQWNDQQGSLNLSQSTLGFRPIYNITQQNGLPSVSFDGINDVMRTGATTIPFANGYEMFFVWKLRTWTSSAYLMSWDNDFDLLCDFLGSSPQGAWLTAGFHHNIPTNLAPGVWSIMDLTAQANGLIRSQLNNNSPDMAGTYAPTVSVTFSLAAQAGVADFCALDVGEVLVYGCELSDADRTAARAYLNGRWGIF